MAWNGGPVWSDMAMHPTVVTPMHYGMQFPMPYGMGMMPMGSHMMAGVPAVAATSEHGNVLPKAMEQRIATQNERKEPSLPPPAPPEHEMEGSLKSLSGRHGYGFIACEEVHRIYGRDVYLPRELVTEDFKVLDRIKFKVKLSDKGHPQAESVRPAL